MTNILNKVTAFLDVASTAPKPELPRLSIRTPVVSKIKRVKGQQK